MIVETGPFEAVRFFRTDESQLQLIRDAIETGNPGSIANAIGVIARARGMSVVAREIEMNRPTLYNVLSDKGNPTLETIVKVLGSLGLQLDVRKLGEA